MSAHKLYDCVLMQLAQTFLYAALEFSLLACLDPKAELWGPSSAGLES